MSSVHFYQLLVALLAIALGGCNKGLDDRLLGKWTFDHDYTAAHLPPATAKAQATPAPSPANAKGTPSEGASMGAEINGLLNNEVKPMVTEMLLGQMKGQTFTITPKLITDSSGKAQTYQVVEHASADSWSIKTADGEIATYTLEDGRIAFPTTGSVHFKLYFKRVAP